MFAGIPTYEGISALFSEAGDEMEPGAIARDVMYEPAAAITAGFIIV